MPYCRKCDCYCQRSGPQGRCKKCSCCQRCCRCVKICEHCRISLTAEQFGKHFCVVCNQCRRVCKCRNMPYMKNDIPQGVQGFVNKLPRALGLEVELADWGLWERVQKPQTLKCHPESDGSVKPSGLELVVEAAIGDTFVKNVLDLGECLALAEAEINESCGFHVHVDARDFGYYDMRRLLAMFVRVQGEIYEYVVPMRAGNTFCVPFTVRETQNINALWQVTRPSELKAAVIRFVYGEIRAAEEDPVGPCTRRTGDIWLERKKSKYGGGGNVLSRYKGLNVLSWFYRGTIEWRMHEGTVAIGDLLNWALFCGWFVELAAKTSDVVVQKEVSWKWIVERMPVSVQEWIRVKTRQAAG